MIKNKFIKVTVNLAVIFLFIFVYQAIAQQSSLIKEIRIQGNHWTEEDEIEKVIKSKVGEVFSKKKVREDIQLIYDLGYFSYLEALQESTSEGIILIFVVEENRKIVEIEFNGVEGGELNELKKMLAFKNEEVWNFKKVKKSKEKITEFYFQRGYLSAKIDISSLALKDDRCKAVISVEKGKLIRVMEVEIEGNHFFPDPKICSLMQTKFRGYFDKELLEKDIKKITQTYQEAGYYFAHIKEPKFEFFRKEGVDWVRIFLEVIEEKRFSVGGIDVEGNYALATSQILDQVKPQKGEIFDPAQLKESVYRIQDIYGQRGYLYARVDSNFDFNREKGLARIEIVIKENEQVRIGNIKIEGNKITKPVVFNRTILLKKGGIFDTKKLRESWRKLYNLGFFEKVEMKPYATSSPLILDLLVKVQETDKQGGFYFGATYSSNSELGGFIQINKDNLWGEGKKIGIDWEFGKNNNEYDINYLDRWYQGSSTTLNISLYDKRYEYSYTGLEYTKRTSGGLIGLGWPWDEYLHFSLTAKVERVNVVGEELPEDLKGENRAYQSLIPTLTRDSRVRDEDFNSYKGSYSRVSVEKSGGFLGGDVDFTRYEIETRVYLRQGEFWKSLILAFRLRGEWGDNLPYYEEFYIGGQYTLRGYRENEFSGTGALLGTLELRIPLQRGTLVYVFVDTGKVWGGDPMPEFKTGYGFGLQINSAIGTLRFDYGISKEGGKFYFGMGEIF